MSDSVKADLEKYYNDEDERTEKLEAFKIELEHGLQLDLVDLKM